MLLRDPITGSSIDIRNDDNHPLHGKEEQNEKQNIILSEQGLVEIPIPTFGDIKEIDRLGQNNNADENNIKISNYLLEKKLEVRLFFEDIDTFHHDSPSNHETFFGRRMKEDFFVPIIQER